MLLVGCTLGDPAADELDLRRRYLAVRFRRRHLVVWIMRHHALQYLALFWMSRHDREDPIVIFNRFTALV